MTTKRARFPQNDAHTLADDGDARADTVLATQAQPGYYFTAVQVGPSNGPTDWQADLGKSKAELDGFSYLLKETDAKGSFGVQVALANDQAKADELAKKFQSAGYQVKTSATSRGVRVIVGPERGKVAALALKDKINSDPKVNTTSAWVLYWR